MVGESELVGSWARSAAKTATVGVVPDKSVAGVLANVLVY